MCLGENILPKRRALSADEKLLEIWSRGQRALSQPLHKPISFLVLSKLALKDPRATAFVPNAAQYAGKFVKKLQE
jgi:hypothetical protein